MLLGRRTGCRVRYPFTILHYTTTRDDGDGALLARPRRGCAELQRGVLLVESTPGIWDYPTCAHAPLAATPGSLLPRGRTITPNKTKPKKCTGTGTGLLALAPAWQWSGAGGPGGRALRQRSPSDRESLRARWGEGKAGGLWRTISVESPPRPIPRWDRLVPTPLSRLPSVCYREVVR